MSLTAEKKKEYRRGQDYVGDNQGNGTQVELSRYLLLCLLGQLDLWIYRPDWRLNQVDELKNTCKAQCPSLTTEEWHLVSTSTKMGVYSGSRVEKAVS